MADPGEHESANRSNTQDQEPDLPWIWEASAPELYRLVFNKQWEKAAERIWTGKQQQQQQQQQQGRVTKHASVTLEMLKEETAWRSPSNGMTAVHYACLRQAPHSIVEALLCVAHLNACRTTDHSGRTPLHHAARFSSLRVVSQIVQRHPKGVDERDHQGKTPLCLAQDAQRSDAVLRTLGSARKLGDAMADRDWYTVRNLLSRSEHQSAVKSALFSNNDKYPHNDIDNGSPLHQACRFAAPPDMIRLLLQLNRRAALHTDHNGQTPLHILVDLKHEEHDNTNNNDDNTPSQSLESDQEHRLISLAVLLEAHPEAASVKDTIQGDTPLLLLVKRLQKANSPHAQLLSRMAIQLVQLSDDPSMLLIMDDEGQSPLFCACGGNGASARSTTNNNITHQNDTNEEHDNDNEDNETPRPMVHTRVEPRVNPRVAPNPAHDDADEDPDFHLDHQHPNDDDNNNDNDGDNIHVFEQLMMAGIVDPEEMINQQNVNDNANENENAQNANENRNGIANNNRANDGNALLLGKVVQGVCAANSKAATQRNPLYRWTPLHAALYHGTLPPFALETLLRTNCKMIWALDLWAKTPAYYFYKHACAIVGNHLIDNTTASIVANINNNHNNHHALLAEERNFFEMHWEFRHDRLDQRTRLAALAALRDAHRRHAGGVGPMPPDNRFCQEISQKIELLVRVEVTGRVDADDHWNLVHGVFHSTLLPRPLLAYVLKYYSKEANMVQINGTYTIHVAAVAGGNYTLPGSVRPSQMSLNANRYLMRCNRCNDMTGPVFCAHETLPIFLCRSCNLLGRGEGFSRLVHGRGGSSSVGSEQGLRGMALTLLKKELEANPKAAGLPGPQGLPLHLALRVGKRWTEGVKDLFVAAPQALQCRDPTTFLYPFMMAASKDIHPHPHESIFSSSAVVRDDDEDMSEEHVEFKTGDRGDFFEFKGRRTSTTNHHVQDDHRAVFHAHRRPRVRFRRAGDANPHFPQDGPPSVRAPTPRNSSTNGEGGADQLSTIFNLLIEEPSVVKGGIF